MEKKERLTYGSFVVLWDPDFNAVRAAMDAVEAEIKKHREDIDPETIVTRVRYGCGPLDIYVSWCAKGKDWKEEQDDRQGGSAEM